MDVIIKPQNPDGINLKIENIIVDTYEQVFKIIEVIDKLEKEG